MFMIELKDLGWWYWLVTASLLTVGLLNPSTGFILAIGLTVFQLAHFAIRERSVTVFSVQVRFWYLLLLIIALPEPMQLLYWIPCIGTWAQVIFGYCAMARIVSLFPWNRNEAFSLKLLFVTFFSRPVRGSVKQGFSPVE
jgi:hypothetical protein